MEGGCLVLLLYYVVKFINTMEVNVTEFQGLKKKKKALKFLIPFVTFPSIVLELILTRSYHKRFCLEAQSRGPGAVTSSPVHILVSRPRHKGQTH